MNNQLNLNYLINYLLDSEKIYIEKKKYLIESYPSLRFNYNIDLNIFIYIIIVATKKVDYKIDDNFNVMIDYKLIENTKLELLEFVKNINDQNINKNKIETYIKSSNLNCNIILILSKFYNINILIFNVVTKIAKCYYYDDYCNINNPFIVIKESSIYDLLLLNNKYLFNNTHPIIEEIFEIIYAPHFNNCKKEFKIQTVNEKIQLKLVPLKIIKFINKIKNRSNFVK